MFECLGTVYCRRPPYRRSGRGGHPEFFRNDHPVCALRGCFAAFSCRGRDGDHSPPPAQIRTYRFPISGSCLRSTAKAHRRVCPVVLLDRPAPAHWANRAGSVSRVCRAWTSFPWPDPFPPPPPLRCGPLCSAASPVLQTGPTSHDPSSSAFVLRLPGAVCLLRRPWDLPVPD